MTQPPQATAYGSMPWQSTGVIMAAGTLAVR